MRIAHFIPSLRRGGSERMAVQLAKHQHESGHEVELVVFSDVNEWENELNGVHVQAFPNVYVQRRKWRKPITKDVTAFLHWFQNYQPDVIHSHAIYTDIIRFLLLPVARNTVQVSHLHLYHPILFDWTEFDPDRKWLLKQYMRSNTQLVTVSDQQFRKAQRIFPDPLKQQLHQINNGVVIHNHNKQPEKRGNSSTILVVSSLEKHKNIEAAIWIFDLLNKQMPQTSMQIAGDGSQLESLETLAKNLGVFEQIDFLGSVVNMEEVYSQADVFLHVSPEETFGLAPLEALAREIPVVSLFPSVAFLQHGVNALIARNYEYGACAKLIHQLLTEKEMAYNLVSKGLETAQEYNFQTSFEDFLKLYENCDSL